MSITSIITAGLAIDKERLISELYSITNLPCAFVTDVHKMSHTCKSDNVLLKWLDTLSLKSIKHPCVFIANHTYTPI